MSTLKVNKLEPLSGDSIEVDKLVITQGIEIDGEEALSAADIGVSVQAYDSAIQTHLSDDQNPHSVTAAQVGALVPGDIGVTVQGYNKDTTVQGVISITSLGGDAAGTARPASDVYSWAKAESKPSYSYSEVGASPSNHTHSDKADLVNGTVPSNQLPSYVDDVLEYADTDHLPATGEANKIYVTLDTNLTYRWSGSGYTEISKSLALGDTETTAYRGDRGKAAYDHSTSAHAPSDAEKNVNADWSATDGDAAILNKPTLGSAAAADTDDFEANLGEPAADDYILSSKADGTRSWIKNTPIKLQTTTPTVQDFDGEGSIIGVYAP